MWWLASMNHQYSKLYSLCCCFCYCYLLFCPHKCTSLIIFGQVVCPNMLECQLPTLAIVEPQCQCVMGHCTLPVPSHLYTCPTFVIVLHHNDTSFGAGSRKVPRHLRSICAISFIPGSLALPLHIRFQVLSLSMT
jgi:hypothetical protein